MGKVIEIKSKLAQADRFLLAIQLDPNNKQLEKELADWIMLSNENEEAYLEALIMSDDINIGLQEYKPVEKKEGISIDQQVSILPVSNNTDKRRSLFSVRYLVASIVFLMLFAGMFNQWKDSIYYLNADFVTSTAEFSDNLLSDGSTVHMNVNSAMNRLFNEQIRTLDLLKGEVFVEVAKDKNRPFVVNIGNAKITALGTAFNIKKTETWSELQLTHGSVSVNFPGIKVEKILEMGEKIRWNQNTGAFTVSNHHLKNRPNWLRGLIRVNEIRLSELLTKLNTYYPQKLLLIDPRKKDLLVTGIVPLKDLNGIKQLLNRVIGLKNVEVYNGLLFFY